MNPLIGVTRLTAQLRELGTAWVSTIVGYDVTGKPIYTATLQRPKRRNQ